jgi:YfiH family protein
VSDRSYLTLPALPESFHWTSEAWGAALRCRALDAVAPHLFSTRQLAFAEGEEQLLRAVDATALVMVSQVHGNAVIVVREGSELPSRALQADAIVSRVPGIAIAVRAADCVPVLIADPVSGAVAAVHAGWRGTAARVATTAVEAMVREYGTRPADLIVAIGPSIGACCYEVGSELVDAFAAAGHERYLIERWFPTPPLPRGARGHPRLRLDVAGANRDQLILTGIPEEQIFASGLCTAMHLDILTSYRAEKQQATRLVGAIRANGSVLNK